MTFISLTCKVPGCGKRTEGTTGLCATHNREFRRIVKPPIKKQSDKRKEEQSIYDEQRKAFLKKNPRCQIFPNLRSQEVHHKKGRAGDLFLDERYWMAVSKKAHTLITLKPTWAKSKGYIITRSAA